MVAQCVQPICKQVSIEILPSGRLGYPVSINRSGRPVFVDSKGVRMCMHGEKVTTIRMWKKAEQADPGFERGSECTCCNVDGLMTARAAAACEPPAAFDPTCDNLYGLLGALDAPEKEIDSRPQRLALKTAGAELWIQPSGMVVCEHGNSRKILSKLCEQRKLCSPAESPPVHFRSKRVARCDCIMKVPRRHGSIFGDAFRAKTKRARARAAAGVPQGTSSKLAIE